jgi:hypothetical protein
MAPPLGLQLYQVAEFGVPNSSRVEPHLAPVKGMAEIIEKIIEVEGPIHAEEIARRVATLWGKDRTGSRISAAVNSALKFMIQSEAILEEKNFWFTLAQREECPVRDRSAVSGSLQRADMLPPMEIRAAVFRALKENGSIGQDEISTAVTRMLGFQRTGPELRAVIVGVVNHMIAAGAVLADQGWLTRSRETATAVA